ncbi:hypothetical protein C8Q73DRAFT_828855 [Cubamyces lactineus]|nr:hypothetical protein C8Q73DRAFT_828855 [Cubamyces lactineus]
MLTLGRPSSTRWILENCSGYVLIIGVRNAPNNQSQNLHLSSSELFTADEKSKAFSQIATKAKEYSEALVERWVKEIDTYLVYAGLFSAILTAFNVESYQLLQPSLPDTSSDILQHISLQLSSLSYIPPFINSTRPAFNSHDVRSTASAVVPQWAVWLNTLWFSSLILSLSSASVGIFVKQWLNEFQSGLSGDSEHVARLRQHRLNNLERCHVESIVNAIPVLLQGALALFLAGLLVLLWMLHRTVAGIASLFVLGIALFIVATSIGPMLTAHCAYLSPQSLALYALLSRVACIIRQKLLATKACLFRLLNKVGGTGDSSTPSLTR